MTTEGPKILRKKIIGKIDNVVVIRELAVRIGRKNRNKGHYH